MTRLLRFGALLAVLAAGGCGWIAVQPPPVEAVNAPPYTGQAISAPRPGSPLAGAGSVTVGPGDTVYGISQRYRVSQRGLIDVNHLVPPYRLIPGQRLVLPHERLHTVVRGDTLYGISRRFGVDMYELAQANRLQPPYAIHVGEQLRIPAVPQAASSPPPPPPSGNSGMQVENLAPPPQTHQEPAVTMAAPPPRASQEPAVTMAAPPPRPTPAETMSPPPARPAVPPARPEVSPQREASASPPPPVAKGKGFIWPTRGHIILDFGPKAKGLHNDGINIAAPLGTPVYAAQGGVVAYAGNQLRGFGNLLLIKHPGGWITAYAHNEVLLVKRGDKVTRGQIIARVGETGNVTTPQLHFEMRRGLQAVDPLNYLTGHLMS